jgi:hypothetical protein
VEVDLLQVVGRLSVDHPTAVLFLDETGVVQPHPTDPFFGIGCLKSPEPSSLVREMRALRQARQYMGELHWAAFDKAELQGRDDVVELACNAIDLIFDDANISFACTIADRGRGDLTSRFRNHSHPAHKAYEHLASQAVAGLIGDRDLVTVLVDDVSTPADVHFEADVARSVNVQADRLAVVNVCRLDSRCTDGLQLIDLLLGAVTFDLRRGLVSESESQKQRILSHVLERCDCPSFRPSGRRDEAKFAVEILTPPRRSRRGRRGGG